jgi:hypothetical protein
VTISDELLIAATVLGPILAVQAQKWVERWRDYRGRKLWVFQTLMATRGSRLVSDHVRALNMIDLLFYGRRRFGRHWPSATEQEVLDKWKEYLDELYVPWDETSGQSANEARLANRDKLFVDLLVALGADVGYKFDRVQLKKGSYFPTAHGTEYQEQQELRRLAIKLLNGEYPLRMDVVKFPSDPATAKAILEVQQRLGAALDGKRSLSVSVRTEDQPRASE